MNKSNFYMIHWYCDDCGEYLNNQHGFTTETGFWKCEKCGFINDVTKNNMLDRKDWKEKKKEWKKKEKELNKELEKQIKLEKESLKIKEYKQRAKENGITLQEYLWFKNLQKMDEIGTILSFK